VSESEWQENVPVGKSEFRGFWGGQEKNIFFAKTKVYKLELSKKLAKSHNPLRWFGHGEVEVDREQEVEVESRGLFYVFYLLKIHLFFFHCFWRQYTYKMLVLRGKSLPNP
jgi:hypothetical protein